MKTESTTTLVAVFQVGLGKIVHQIVTNVLDNHAETMVLVMTASTTIM